MYVDPQVEELYQRRKQRLVQVNIHHLEVYTSIE